MDKFKDNIVIPPELDDAIKAGIRQGQKIQKHRKRVKGSLMKTAITAASVLIIFIGSINAFPAFASSMENIPILRSLVKVFQINATTIEGGRLTDKSQAQLTHIQEGCIEKLVLTFDQKNAAKYHAELAFYPETVTLTLPGTQSIEIISQIERAKDTSNYIKSVYSLTEEDDEKKIQIEIEYTANVQISEYKDPGSIVIELTPSEYEASKVYSVRSYSHDKGESFKKLEESYAGEKYRVLQDEEGKLFLELAQFSDEREAQAYAAKVTKLSVIVEKRSGNSVPTCYDTESQYQRKLLKQEYYEIIIEAKTLEPILAFLDEHLVESLPEDQEFLLAGLTGYLKDIDEYYDPEILDNYYRLVGKSLEEALDN